MEQIPPPPNAPTPTLAKTDSADQPENTNTQEPHYITLKTRPDGIRGYMADYQIKFQPPSMQQAGAGIALLITSGFIKETFPFLSCAIIGALLIANPVKDHSTYIEIGLE